MKEEKEEKIYLKQDILWAYIILKDLNDIIITMNIPDEETIEKAWDCYHRLEFWSKETNKEIELLEKQADLLLEQLLLVMKLQRHKDKVWQNYINPGKEEKEKILAHY